MAQIVLSPPSKGYRTQRFGANPNPEYQPGGHTGDDWAYTDGVNIFPDAYAMDAGEVVWADWASKLGWPNEFYLNPDFNKNDNVDESSGITVCLKHWYGYTTYSHLEETALNIGDKVARGQRIGTVGQTGRSYGKHLHAELILFPLNYNTPTYGRTDPAKYMTASLTPQSTTTPATPKDWFDMATEAQLRKIIREENPNPWVFKNAALERDDAYALLRAARTHSVKAATAAAATNAQITGLVGALNALAKGEKFDEAKLLAGIKAAAEEGSKVGAAAALAEGVVDVNINVAGQPAK